MSLRTLKRNKISAAVALALMALAADSVAATYNNTAPLTATVGSVAQPGAYTYGGQSGTNAPAGPFGTVSLTSSNSDIYNTNPTDTTNSSNTAINTSTIVVATGNGPGIYLASVDSVSYTTNARYYSTGVAGLSGSTVATSLATSVSWTNSNNINNSGTVTADTGIKLYSSSAATTVANSYTYVWANNDGQSTLEYPTATATATAISQSDARVNSNVLVNSGTINASAYGIQLSAVATSTATATSYVDGVWGDVNGPDAYTTNTWGSGSGTATARVTDGTNLSSAVAYANLNNLTNSGSVVVSNGAGIVLSAAATNNATLSATSGVDYNGGSPSIQVNTTLTTTSTRTAVSQVNSNTISNSGTIAANYASGTNASDGIGLYATTSGANASGFTATVDGNTITNTNLIYAMNNGVSLTATSSNTAVTGDNVTNNTINNNYVGWDDAAHTAEGRIVANKIGVNLVASTVDGNTINNSGLIVSDPGMSLNGAALTRSNSASFDNTNVNFVAININGVGTANTLNLNAPGYLAGTILLSKVPNSHTTVNLTSGYSQSNVWSIQNDTNYGPSAVTLNGPLPWFVRGSATGVNGAINNTYATLDPSALAARPNMAADLSDAAHSMVASNMTRDLTAPGQVWISGQLGTKNYDPSESNPVMDQKTNLYTVAVGYDQTVADDYRVGVMAGYNRSELNTGSLYSDLYANSYKNFSTGAYASVYGTTKLGIFALDGALAFGFQEHSDSRFVNDNLTWWGISYAKSKYDSQWVSPSVKLALPMDLGSDWTLSPNAQLAYTYQHVDSYSETGSNSNASYASQGIGVLESKLALDLSKSVGPLKATVTAGYLNRSLESGDSVDVTMIGDTHAVQSWAQTLNAGYAKANVRWDITDKFAFNAAGTYMKGSRSGNDGGNGNISLLYKF